MLDKNLQKEIQKSFQIMFIARVNSLLSLYIYALVICKWYIEYIETAWLTMTGDLGYL